MSEFRKRRRWAIAEWSLAVPVVAIVVLSLISGDVLGFVLAMWWACVQSVIAVFAVRHMRSARARLDLREVYPPRRDDFHRDLERLNELRGKPLVASARLGESWYWDSSSRSWKAHPAPRLRAPLHDSVEILHVIMLGFRDGFIFMAPFLAVMLFGAVIGLFVLLL